MNIMKTIALPVVANQSVAEPPFFNLASLKDPSLPETTVRITTRTGETLRALVQRVADPKFAEKLGVPVEVVALAKHCEDQSHQ